MFVFPAILISSAHRCVVDRSIVDLFESEEKKSVRSEDTAAVFHESTDSLSRHNDLTFAREGLRYNADMVDLEIEINR